jgi:hypothetical protein
MTTMYDTPEPVTLAYTEDRNIVTAGSVGASGAAFVCLCNIRHPVYLKNDRFINKDRRCTLSVDLYEHFKAKVVVACLLLLVIV